MIVIQVRNVHEALPEALHRLHRATAQVTSQASRNGPVRKFSEPVTTVYARPLERVVFWAERDANPFLHLLESMWMLAGRNDLAYMTNLVARFKDFSDDGLVLHGAYGHRWRWAFGQDQLNTIVRRLDADPNDRRAVLAMWSPEWDLVPPTTVSKDLPCNTHVYFSVTDDGCLDMTVCCRSNDLVWGAYGANAVHFSFLQEYIAGRLGLPVGRYWQVSNNLHVYDNVWAQVEPLAAKYQRPDDRTPNPYDHRDIAAVARIPLIDPKCPEVFEDELQRFVEGGTDFESEFFRCVALPMRNAYERYKVATPTDNPLERFHRAQEALAWCRAPDWKRAGLEWLQRRKESFIRRERAKDDGVAYE